MRYPRHAGLLRAWTAAQADWDEDDEYEARFEQAFYPQLKDEVHRVGKYMDYFPVHMGKTTPKPKRTDYGPERRFVRAMKGISNPVILGEPVTWGQLGALAGVGLLMYIGWKRRREV